MKKLFKYIAVLAASVLAFGCYPEVLTPDQDKLPQTSDFDVEIVVDQETNYVTFTMKNQGLVPMWIFGDQKVDKSQNTRFAYTANGIKLRFRDAGTHQVEVKAYNANGVSLGSKTYDFTINNTYRDPFDASKYLTFFAGSDSKVWEWNSTVDGHFGCGEPGTEGTNWWSCKANEKADWGLYDDRLTFTTEGKYTYNPGEGGMVYVNKDSGFGPEYNTNDGNDYLVPIDPFTVDYTFDNNWNAAGIEEVYLVLAQGANLSYIPNPEALTNPRYKLLEGTNTKKLSLVNDNGGISWKYEFILEGSAKPEQPGPGGDVVFDPASDANLWKNAAMDVSFWFADESWGQIANPEYTSTGNNSHTIVIPDGIGSQRWQGQMVFNNTGIVTSADKTYDFQIVLNSTADHGGVTIKLTQQDNDNVFFFEDAHQITAYEEFKYQVKGVQGVDLTNAKLVLDFGGATPGSTVEIKDIVLQEHVGGGVSGPAPFDPAADENMWKNAAMTVTYWFANSSWGQIADPEAVIGDNEYTFVIPDEVGGSEWQGQVVFRNTGLVLSPDKTYDFRAVISSTADGTATIKPCYQHPTELDGNGNPADVNELFYDNAIAVTAYEDLEYVKSGLQGTDIPDLKLVIDLGRFPAGATVTVKDIVIRESKATATEPESGDGASFDPASPANMWLSMNVEEMFYYYAPGWAQIDNPGFEADGNKYVITLPEATNDRWQAQVAFRTDMSSSAAKTYDFYCVLNSTQDIAAVTIKLVKTGDDGVFYFEDMHKVTAYEDYVYKVANMPGIDMEKISLFFDFGGNPADTEVTISDIIFQEHQE